MKIIVGLGNPGNKYSHTRHNIGFRVVDQMAEGQEWKISKKGQLEYLWIDHGDEKTKLVKPQTFMNKSGLALAYVKKKHPQLTGADLFIIHDDLDLEVGKFKLHFGKGPKQHNGLISIHQQLETDQFWHVRIGIDGRRGDRSMSADKYVLSSFSPDERVLIEQAINQVIVELNQHLT